MIIPTRLKTLAKSKIYASRVQIKSVTITDLKQIISGSRFLVSFQPISPLLLSAVCFYSHEDNIWIITDTLDPLIDVATEKFGKISAETDVLFLNSRQFLESTKETTMKADKIVRKNILELLDNTQKIAEDQLNLDRVIEFDKKLEQISKECKQDFSAISTSFR
jgi:hypothetical protein